MTDPVSIPETPAAGLFVNPPRVVQIRTFTAGIGIFCEKTRDGSITHVTGRRVEKAQARKILGDAEEAGRTAAQYAEEAMPFVRELLRKPVEPGGETETDASAPEEDPTSEEEKMDKRLLRSIRSFRTVLADKKTIPPPDGRNLTDTALFACLKAASATVAHEPKLIYLNDVLMPRDPLYRVELALGHVPGPLVSGLAEEFGVSGRFARQFLAGLAGNDDPPRPVPLDGYLLRSSISDLLTGLTRRLARTRAERDGAGDEGKRGKLDRSLRNTERFTARLRARLGREDVLTALLAPGAVSREGARTAVGLLRQLPGFRGRLGRKLARQVVFALYPRLLLAAVRAGRVAAPGPLTPTHLGHPWMHGPRPIALDLAPVRNRYVLERPSDPKAAFLDPTDLVRAYTYRVRLEQDALNGLRTASEEATEEVVRAVLGRTASPLAGPAARFVAFGRAAADGFLGTAVYPADPLTRWPQGLTDRFGPPRGPVVRFADAPFFSCLRIPHGLAGVLRSPSVDFTMNPAGFRLPVPDFRTGSANVAVQVMLRQVLPPAVLFGDGVSISVDVNRMGRQAVKAALRRDDGRPSPTTLPRPYPALFRRHAVSLQGVETEIKRMSRRLGRLRTEKDRLSARLAGQADSPTAVIRASLPALRRALFRGRRYLSALHARVRRLKREIDLAAADAIFRLLRAVRADRLIFEDVPFDPRDLRGRLARLVSYMPKPQVLAEIVLRKAERAGMDLVVEFRDARNSSRYCHACLRNRHEKVIVHRRRDAYRCPKCEAAGNVHEMAAMNLLLDEFRPKSYKRVRTSPSAYAGTSIQTCPPPDGPINGSSVAPPG